MRTHDRLRAGPTTCPRVPHGLRAQPARDDGTGPEEPRPESGRPRVEPEAHLPYREAEGVPPLRPAG
ncbi:hypothetical protein [Streptomyces omiyaensis]|uniref:Uncharacterized protein n=1 Tax=Streptomyces omiyaensis TaxID=68247 RepID=A0ABW7BSI3_9ACTN